jgi:hypothetical protein
MAEFAMFFRILGIGSMNCAICSTALNYAIGETASAIR